MHWRVEKCMQSFGQKPEMKRPLDLDIDGMTILKWLLNK
jgi:hypothetical protein